jgi:ketosteroid isomerase-like protein
MSNVDLEKTVRDMFATSDTMDAEATAEFMTEDIELRFANADPVIGKPSYLETATEFLGSLKAIRHDLHHVWVVEDQVTASEMDVHYERLDGSKLSVPAAVIHRFRDGLIADYRIFADITPLHA